MQGKTHFLYLSELSSQHKSLCLTSYSKWCGFIPDEISDQFWLQSWSAAKPSWGEIWGHEVNKIETQSKFRQLIPILQYWWIIKFCAFFFLCSDSKEERPADNKVDMSIPVLYDAGIVLSRWFYFELPQHHCSSVKSCSLRCKAVVSKHI